MTQVKTNILEVLNDFGITEEDTKNGSQLGYKKKYLFTCFMGSLHRVVNQVKNEYNAGCIALQDLNSDDNAMDSNGGYARMAIERRSGFGFPTDKDKLEEKLSQLKEDYDVVKECYDSHNDSYEYLYGSKFDPNRKTVGQTNTKAKVAKVKKKFVTLA